MRADVIVAFRDRETWRAYAPGDAYEGADARVAELASAGMVSAGGGNDLASMTNPQLAALCRERGLEVPKRATKAQLLELLAGEAS